MTRLLLLAVCLPLLQACGTTKAYEGPKLPADQLATVHALRFSGGGLFPREKTVQIHEVDDKVVGSYYRGFPSTVNVKPGKHELKVLYFDSSVHGPGTGEVAAGVLGGAIGGAIYAAATEPRVQREGFVLELDAKAGTEYVIDFDTSASNPNEVPVWIADKNTGEIVFRWDVSSGTAAGATAPAVEEEIARAEWRALTPGRSLKVYAKSGQVYAGRLNSFDGEYLWLWLRQGGKKALLASETARITALK